MSTQLKHSNVTNAKCNELASYNYHVTYLICGVFSYSSQMYLAFDNFNFSIILPQCVDSVITVLCLSIISSDSSALRLGSENRRLLGS